MKQTIARCSVIAVAAAATSMLVAARAAEAVPAVAIAPSLVVTPINGNDLVTLPGNTSTLTADQGLASPEQQLGPLFMVLRRSPAQERALEAFSASQLDRASSNYHHWLQPQEFGLKYGANDADISTVMGWLKAQGLQVQHVSQGRIAIEFSGSVAQVQAAFGVEMHRYLVKGATLIGNDRDPQIPRALSPVIAGLVGLSAVPVTPRRRMERLREPPRLEVARSRPRRRRNWRDRRQLRNCPIRTARIPMRS